MLVATGSRSARACSHRSNSSSGMARPPPHAVARPRRAAWRPALTMPDGGAGSCGGPCAALACRLPVPGQKLVQLMAFGSPGDDALEHVGQVGLRIEVGD